MSERHLTILQINDLHGYLEPHPEVFRGRGRFDYRTCGDLARIASIFKEVRAERPHPPRGAAKPSFQVWPRLQFAILYGPRMIGEVDAREFLRKWKETMERA